MPRIERQIVINRPVEEVFDFLADGRNDPLWNREDLHMEQAPEGPVGVDTTFEGQVILILLGRRDLVYRISAYDRPRSFSFTMIKPPVPVDLLGTAVFELVPGGTKMSWRLDLAPRGLLKPLSPLLAGLVGRRLDDSLPQIKQLLESGVY